MVLWCCGGPAVNALPRAKPADLYDDGRGLMRGVTLASVPARFRRVRVPGRGFRRGGAGHVWASGWCRRSRGRQARETSRAVASGGSPRDRIWIRRLHGEALSATPGDGPGSVTGGPRTPGVRGPLGEATSGSGLALRVRRHGGLRRGSHPCAQTAGKMPSPFGETVLPRR